MMTIMVQALFNTAFLFVLLCCCTYGLHWIALNFAPVSAPPTDEMENAVEQETLEELIADVLATVLLKFWWPTVAADVRR